MTQKEKLFSLTKKDFQLTYFSGTGGGGQHRNKHMNCVRLCHPSSGVRVTGQSHKSRKDNLRQAFKNLFDSPHFKVWMTRKMMEITSGKTIEERVEAMMTPENLRFEVRDEDGRWVEDEQE